MDDLAQVAIGSGGTVILGIVIAFLRGSFARSVAAADAQLLQLGADVRYLLLEQRTHASSLESVNEKLSLLKASTAAFHDRLDERERAEENAQQKSHTKNRSEHANDHATPPEPPTR